MPEPTQAPQPGVRIISDPAIMLGKPIIEGRRITVEHVMGEIVGGASIEDVQHEYALTREQVIAALEYAYHLVAADAQAAVRRARTSSEIA